MILMSLVSLALLVGLGERRNSSHLLATRKLESVKLESELRGSSMRDAF